MNRQTRSPLATKVAPRSRASADKSATIATRSPATRLPAANPTNRAHSLQHTARCHSAPSCASSAWNRDASFTFASTIAVLSCAVAFSIFRAPLPNSSVSWAAASAKCAPKSSKTDPRRRARAAALASATSPTDERSIDDLGVRTEKSAQCGTRVARSLGARRTSLQPRPPPTEKTHRSGRAHPRIALPRMVSRVLESEMPRSPRARCPSNEKCVSTHLIRGRRQHSATSQAATTWPSTRAAASKHRAYRHSVRAAPRYVDCNACSVRAVPAKDPVYRRGVRDLQSIRLELPVDKSAV